MHHHAILNILLSIALLALVNCQSETSKENNDKSYSMDDRFSSINCNGPDAPMLCAFVNMPNKLTSTMEIIDETSEGEPLTISGQIIDKENKRPFKDLIIYAYQTDHTGKYTKTGNEYGVQNWHGRLHGWCKTDKDGSYKINTIKPAPYPNGGMPAHIHLTVLEPNDTAYYINDIVFSNDSLLTPQYLDNLNAKGGDGVVELSKNEKGVWIGQRNIEL